jgi:hypothetical protein
MQKLIPVEEAKALMREAAGWSVWGWLTEKRRLRTTADAAWAALEDTEQRAKEAWSDEAKRVWREFDKQPGIRVEPELKVAIERVREADEEWREARAFAEATFDEADRRMSTELAREGTEQAIQAWELAERAIRRAEALSHRSARTSKPPINAD